MRVCFSSRKTPAGNDLWVEVDGESFAVRDGDVDRLLGDLVAAVRRIRDGGSTLVDTVTWQYWYSVEHKYSRQPGYYPPSHGNGGSLVMPLGKSDLREESLIEGKK